jgi:hypothetical protein
VTPSMLKKCAANCANSPGENQTPENTNGEYKNRTRDPFYAKEVRCQLRQLPRKNAPDGVRTHAPERNSTLNCRLNHSATGAYKGLNHASFELAASRVSSVRSTTDLMVQKLPSTRIELVTLAL